MTGRAVLPVAAVLSVVFAACAVPMLTPQQNSQYCTVDVHGPSGAPMFLQSGLLDPAAEAAAEGFGNASLLGVFFLSVFTHLPLLEIGDPRTAVRAANACDPDKLPRPGALTEFRHVLDTTHAEVLARALKAELDAPRPACALSRAHRDPAAAPDGRVEIEVVAVIAGCLYGQVQYRVDARWTLKSAQTDATVVAKATQCVLESRRTVEDWLDHPALARAELENALAATGRRVARELVVGYPPAAQCVLHSDTSGSVDIR